MTATARDGNATELLSTRNDSPSAWLTIHFSDLLVVAVEVAEIIANAITDTTAAFTFMDKNLEQCVEEVRNDRIRLHTEVCTSALSDTRHRQQDCRPFRSATWTGYARSTPRYTWSITNLFGAASEVVEDWRVLRHLKIDFVLKIDFLSHYITLPWQPQKKNKKNSPTAVPPSRRKDTVGRMALTRSLTLGRKVLSDWSYF